MQIYTDKLFTAPAEIIEIFDPARLKDGFRQIEECRKKDLYLLGYTRYDLTKPSDKPILYFEAYQSWKENKPDAPKHKAGTIIKPKISQEEYIRAINTIKERILDGITYEVNYTYPSVLETNADEL